MIRLPVYTYVFHSRWSWHWKEGVRERLGQPVPIIAEKKIFLDHLTNMMSAQWLPETHGTFGTKCLETTTIHLSHSENVACAKGSKYRLRFGICIVVVNYHYISSSSVNRRILHRCVPGVGEHMYLYIAISAYSEYSGYARHPIDHPESLGYLHPACHNYHSFEGPKNAKRWVFRQLS